MPEIDNAIQNRRKHRTIGSMTISASYTCQSGVLGDRQEIGMQAGTYMQERYHRIIDNFTPVLWILPCPAIQPHVDDPFRNHQKEYAQLVPKIVFSQKVKKMQETAFIFIFTHILPGTSPREVTHKLAEDDHQETKFPGRHMGDKEIF
jgi:hypothetical protein